MTTKIHGAVNDHGKAVKLKLTPGQVNDVTQAELMLEGLEAEHVIGDKAYDSDDLRQTIRSSGAKPVIPSRKGIRRRRYDKELYKNRNIIERFFNRLKHYRRVATRYDKTDPNFLGFVLLAAVFVTVI